MLKILVFQTVLHWLYQTKNLIKVTRLRSDQSNPKAAGKVTPQLSIIVTQSNDTLHPHNEDLGSSNNLNGKIRLGLLCLIDQSNPKSHGYFDQPFRQTYKQGPLLSSEQLLRSYEKKIWMCYTREWRDIKVSINIKVLEKPWKLIKVTPFNVKLLPVNNDFLNFK